LCKRLKSFFSTETNDKNKEVQVARLLNLLGPDGLQLYNSLKNKDVFVVNILDHLREHCDPTKIKLWITRSILRKNKVKMKL